MTLNVDHAVVLLHLHEMGLLELLLHLGEHVLHAPDLLVLLQQQSVRFRDGRVESVRRADRVPLQLAPLAQGVLRYLGDALRPEVLVVHILQRKSGISMN